ncbi:hypothetical protein MNV49_002197 [Pseudohyphozyma bogoriensis]|nr:hypothetical protein MNV49_002197 [Pseudohyphozyma bogoriensis]
MSAVTPISERPQGKIICLFDVDETLTPARRSVSQAMLDTIAKLRTKVVVGFLGGSDFAKISDQLTLPGSGNVLDNWDFGFAENGLTAYKLGQPLESQSFIKFLGEEKYKALVKFVLHYIADLDIPIKRGTFIEFRNGMVNISPIGRNASNQERGEFEAYDKIHQVRAALIEAIKKEFPDYGLTYSIGGQISFDAFPHGWDKTYALRHVEHEGFSEIHFFGDKTFKGGNDYEVFTDPRTIGHTVHGPEDTIKQLTELFNL